MNTVQEQYDLFRERTSVKSTNSADMSTAVSVTDAPSNPLNKLVMVEMLISTDTDMNIIVQEETSGTVFIDKIYIAAYVPFLLSTTSKMFKAAVANKKIDVLASVAGNITVTCWYYEEL